MDASDLKAIYSTKLNNYVCSRFSEKRYVFKWSFENFSQAEGELHSSECYPFQLNKNVFTVKKYRKNGLKEVVQIDIDSTSVIKCEIYFCGQDGKLLKAPTTGRDLSTNTFKKYYGFCLEQEILKGENCLTNDCLTIIGVIKLKGNATREFHDYCPRFSSSSDYLQKLASDLKGLDVESLSEKVQLIINSEQLQVNSSILCCRSIIFSNKYNSAKDSTKVLPVTLNIDNVRYSVFKNVISFLYSGTIQEEDFQELCDLYESANQYGIFELRDACGDLLWSKLTTQDACGLLILSDKFNDVDFKFFLLAYVKFHFEEIVRTSGWQNMMVNNPLLGMEVINFDNRPRQEPEEKTNEYSFANIFQSEIQ